MFFSKLFKALFKKILTLFATNLAIDLGTANTIIYRKNIGITLNEPSIVAMIDNGSAKIPYLFGARAKIMIGRTPANITISSPIKDGMIADLKITEEMIEYFISQVYNGYKITRPIVIVGMPYQSTSTDKIALQEAITKAGAREVYLVHNIIAAAIGINLPITEHSGWMVVNIGDGITEIAIMALGGIINGRSIKIAGNKFMQAIMDHIKTKNNLLIGQSAAENIKETIGCAYVEEGNVKKMSVKGRDSSTGLPKEIEITQENIAYAISPMMIDIIKAIKEILDSVPPELSSDIIEKGIILTGGCAKIQNIDKVISNTTGISVFVANEPSLAVAKGLGKIIDNFNLYSNFCFKHL